MKCFQPSHNQYVVKIKKLEMEMATEVRKILAAPITLNVNETFKYLCLDKNCNCNYLETDKRPILPSSHTTTYTPSQTSTKPLPKHRCPHWKIHDNLMLHCTPIVTIGRSCLLCIGNHLTICITSTTFDKFSWSSEWPLAYLGNKWSENLQNWE